MQILRNRFKWLKLVFILASFTLPLTTPALAQDPLQELIRALMELDKDLTFLAGNLTEGVKMVENDVPTFIAMAKNITVLANEMFGLVQNNTEWVKDDINKVAFAAQEIGDLVQLIIEYKIELAVGVVLLYATARILSENLSCYVFTVNSEKSLFAKSWRGLKYLYQKCTRSQQQIHSKPTEDLIIPIEKELPV